MVTSARPMGGRFTVPLKMQSLMRPARSDLWLCSPNTQLMASTTFDLPHPFGPTMHVVPVPLNVTTVRSQNDLNPVISTLRSFSKMSPLTLSFSDVRSTWRTFRKFAFFPVLCVQTHYTRRERSEEHTSELQSRFDLVCRLL